MSACKPALKKNPLKSKYQAHDHCAPGNRAIVCVLGAMETPPDGNKPSVCAM